MKIFGFNITRDKKESKIWTHVAFVSTKRGRKILYLNGKELKIKNFTVDFWTTEEGFTKLDQLTYAKIIKGNKNV